jgi:hypothetical protein
MESISSERGVEPSVKKAALFEQATPVVKSRATMGTNEVLEDRRGKYREKYKNKIKNGVEKATRGNKS